MQLNEITVRQKYKEFYGKNTEKMELLIKDNRIPLNMKDIIERRLNSEQEDWKNNYFDTCDALVQFNGKIKIIRNCKILKQISSRTSLENGRIKITESQYKKLKGKEFKISELKLNNYLTKEEAKSHPIWKYLLENYLNKYVDLVFNKRSGENMALWINQEELILRAWYVCRLEYRSYANGRYNLDIDYGRLVGVATELQELKDE